MRQGISHMSAFVGLEGTTEELELVSANQWCLDVGREHSECPRKMF